MEAIDYKIEKGWNKSIVRYGILMLMVLLSAIQIYQYYVPNKWTKDVVIDYQRKQIYSRTQYFICKIYRTAKICFSSERYIRIHIGDTIEYERNYVFNKVVRVKYREDGYCKVVNVLYGMYQYVYLYIPAMIAFFSLLSIYKFKSIGYSINLFIAAFVLSLSELFFILYLT